MKKPKIPKDLGIKIGTKAEVMWTTVKDNVETEIESALNGLLVNKELLLIAKKKIAEEQKRGKV